MTQTEMMQRIVEAAGEKWSEGVCECNDCMGYYNCANPEPTDLNELFRLAGKLV